MNEYIAGSSTIIDEIFLRDVTSPTGGGKVGLLYNTGGLSCYYVRSNGTGSVVVPLVNMTLGTYASGSGVGGGFKEVDSTHAPGVYQFCPPAAALAPGATSVTFYFQGTGVVPQPIKYRILGGINPDVTLAAALLAASVDGSLTLNQVLTAMGSFMNGALSVVNNNDGTVTITFKKRDNTSTAFTVTYNTSTFVRAAAGTNG